MYKLRNISLLLGLVISILSCDNLDISTTQSKSFVKIFGSSESDIGNDVKEFNGGYLLLTTTSFETEISDIVLLQTDHYGNLKSDGIDTLSSLRGGNNIASKLLLTQDGGFIVLGTIEDTLNNDLDIYINKFNSNVESEWEKIIGVDQNNDGTSVNEEGASIKKASSGYIIAGSSDEKNTGNGQKDIYLVKIDDQGNIEWTENHGFDGNDYASDIIVIDNGYMIVGTTENSLHDQAQDNIIVIKTNLVGDSPDINTYGGNNNDYGAAIVKSNNGGYVVTGTVENIAGDNPSIYTVKIEDEISNILWEEQYEEAFPAHAYDLIKSNGGYVIAGDVELTSGMAAGFLKIDGEGEILIGHIEDDGRDALTYGGYGQTINSIEPTSDGGFIMIGSSGAEGNEMIYLLKVNSEGEL